MPPSLGPRYSDALGRLVVKPADVKLGIVSCRGRLGSVTFCILTYFWKNPDTENRRGTCVGGRYEKPHFSFYKQFTCSGILNNEHVAYAVADVLFTLWAYQQKALSISKAAASTLT